MNYKVMKTDQFEKSVFYRVACACSDPNHDLTLELEKDDFPYISLNIFGKIRTSIYYGDHNWFGRQWRRIKLSMKLLFTGYIEMQEDFLMMDNGHIDSFIKALEEGREYLKSKKDTQ